ncbi:MAG: hypothetical protein WD176_03465, partial [Pirellulales bacterium]
AARVPLDQKIDLTAQPGRVSATGGRRAAAAGPKEQRLALGPRLSPALPDAWIPVDLHPTRFARLTLKLRVQLVKLICGQRRGFAAPTSAYGEDDANPQRSRRYLNLHRTLPLVWTTEAVPVDCLGW